MEKTLEQLALEEIESDADFVVFSRNEGVVSEHYTVGEARMSFYERAFGSRLGEHLPRIYQREETHWVSLS
jgi:hypothetical protein